MVPILSKQSWLLVLIGWAWFLAPASAQPLGARAWSERVAAASAAALGITQGYAPGKLDLLLREVAEEPSPADPAFLRHQLHAGLGLVLSVALSGLVYGLLHTADVADGRADRAYERYLAAVEPVFGLRQYEEAHSQDTRARAYLLAGSGVSGLAFAALGWSVYHFLTGPAPP